MRPCYRERLCLALGALAAGILIFVLLAFGVLALAPETGAAGCFSPPGQSSPCWVG